ncbi:helix-turn-helix domain-containing protein [bacterium]|nr:helix-turn-helix domain-containing protein [bacterium]
MEKKQKEAFRKKVGKIVERLRLEKGMSRKELGVQLGYKENTASQVVSRFELGRAGIPKGKIEKLIKLLGMTNMDFGLESTKSLRNFIAASGFLGFPMHTFGNVMVDYLDARDAEEAKAALTDSDDDDEETEDNEDSLGQGTVNYFSVARLMTLYRIGMKTETHSLLKCLNVLDYLCKGDESTFAEVLATLKISPEEAYTAIEKEIIKKMKK